MRWLVAILGWRHRETDIPDFVRRTDASTVAAVQRLLMEPADGEAQDGAT